MPMYERCGAFFSNLERAKISTLKSSNPKMADRVIYELLFSLTASPEICQAGGTSTKTSTRGADTTLYINYTYQTPLVHQPYNQDYSKPF